MLSRVKLEVVFPVGFLDERLSGQLVTTSLKVNQGQLRISDLLYDTVRSDMAVYCACYKALFTKFTGYEAFEGSTIHRFLI